MKANPNNTSSHQFWMFEWMEEKQGQCEAVTDAEVELTDGEMQRSIERKNSLFLDYETKFKQCLVSPSFDWNKNSMG